jgi:hypothetical protein
MTIEGESRKRFAKVMSTNQGQILNTLDALAVATFVDIGKQIDKNGDAARVEIYYRRAVRAAETIYGPYHGEVGLVLLRLAAFYRRNGRTIEAEQAEDRIAAIEDLYRMDQAH